uniref:Uncharacterized protein n=1 Tax=Oryza meridionalis TaxID=40149 RepID=A0A0E0CZH1_9ORYZ
MALRKHQPSGNAASISMVPLDFPSQELEKWRIPDGLPISVLKGHTGVVTAIAFSPRPGAAFQLLSERLDVGHELTILKFLHLQWLLNHLVVVHVKDTSLLLVIWEGKPVQIYETGHFKLVDGKFSPDGTSLILSDEIGQIFIIGTGQGESQKDAKYDQFFLGDYRPLIQDTNGNVIDQETQLAPYRRNMQDLLCDSGMIPYPEPFQSMYQKRRLGTLGIEWRPPSVNFAVGPTYNATTGEYQIIPVIDPDRWEPLPEITDFIELEPENEVISDDTDSEYDGLDEHSSEGEQEALNGGCGYFIWSSS